MTSKRPSREHGRKLVFVIGSLNVGGTERHVADLVPALAARGFEVIVYCLSEAGALAPALRATGVRVEAPPRAVGAPARLGRVGRLIRLGLSVIRLFLLLRRERPIAAHCFLPVANILGTLTARAARVPRVLTSRRSLNRYQTKHPLLGRLERRLHHHADAIVANSNAAARELAEEEQAPADRVQVIHNGIALRKFENASDRAKVRAQLGLRDDAFVIIIVANLIPYKGHLDLVAALGTTAESLPPHWTLLVVGRDDGAGAAIRDAAGIAGIANQVVMLGSRSDIPTLLQAADLGVLASHEEGFPTAVVEYMAAGLPVVATAVGGTREAMADGETGWLVPAHDPAALGRAIAALAADPKLRRQMGEAGRLRAHAAFSLDACVSAYGRLYDRVLPVFPDPRGADKTGGCAALPASSTSARLPRRR